MAKGFSGLPGGGNMQALMQQAQKMQKEMQKERSGERAMGEKDRFEWRDAQRGRAGG